jgi:hypothetical protein
MSTGKVHKPKNAAPGRWDRRFVHRALGDPFVLFLGTLEEQKDMQHLRNTILHVCIRGFLVFVVAAIAAGCASIVDGRPQPITITSNPANAKLIVYDMRKGEAILNATTPHTATLARGAGYFKKAKYKVVVEKEGFEQKEIMIEGVMNGWYAGNLLFGGLIGFLVVDPLSGAMWKLDPKDITVELAKTLAISRPDQGLVLLLKETLDPFPEIVDRMQPLAWRGE